MTAPIITEAGVLQGTNPTLLARATDPAGVVIDQAAVSAISYKTYDLADPTVVVDSGALSKTEVIYNTLQTDDRWTADSTGYNFAWIVPTASIPNADKTYRAEVTIDLVDADHGNVILIFDIEIEDVLGVADV